MEKRFEYEFNAGADCPGCDLEKEDLYHILENYSAYVYLCKAAFLDVFTKDNLHEG